MKRKYKIALIVSLIGNLFVVYVAYKALEYRSHINHFLDKYTNVVAEFSGRDRYAADNAYLAADSLVADRIVFFGSQVTSGWDLPDFFPRYRTVNRGLSEQRLAGYLLRFRPDVIDLKPRAVVIEFSSYNFRPENTLAETKDYLVSLAELARANGIEPILTTVLPVRNDLYYEKYSVQDSLVVFNRWLMAFCRDHDYRLVDFNTIVADTDGFLRAELSTGHIELNQRGYDAISEATRAALPDPD